MKSFFNIVMAALSVLLLLLTSPGVLNASGDGPCVHSPVPADANFLLFHASTLNDDNRAVEPSIVTPSLKFDTSIETIRA